MAGWLAGAARATRGLPPVAPSPAEPPSLAPASQPPVLPPPPIAGLGPGPEPEPVVHFPIIEEAVNDLEGRRILTRPDFDALATDAKTTAFTAARMANWEALGRLAQAVAVSTAEGSTLAAFRAAVDEALGPDFLSPGHIENVFRTNVSQAYSTGLMQTLAHPLVADEFPYLAYHAVHDGRVRQDHLTMEELGLDGTNVYRRDDPIWERFTPPWDYQCRCAIVPMTVEDAARAGVREARQWLRDGLPPATPQWVQPPPFNPPPGWKTREAVRMSEGWITIGGHSDEEKGTKHTGGRRVYVKNGRILYGDIPHSLFGTSVEDFKSKIETYRKNKKGVDKASPIGDNRGIDQPATYQEKKMGAQEKLSSLYQKKYPSLTSEEANKLAEEVVGLPEDSEERFQAAGNAMKLAREIHLSRTIPAVDPVPLRGTEKQIAFAESVRKRVLASFLKKIADAEENLALIRSDRDDRLHGDRLSRIEQAKQSTVDRLTRIAKLASAAWWLDHKHNDFTNLSDSIFESLVQKGS